MPSKEELRRLFEYKDGYLYRREKKKYAKSQFGSGSSVGYLNNRGYTCFRIGKKSLKVHRAIWVFFNGDIPKNMVIDHIDQDKSNNRIENLRCVSQMQNSRNRRITTQNKSGCLGVLYSKGEKKYKSYINFDGQTKHLGTFETYEQAKRSRKAAEVMHGYHKNHGRRV